MQDKHISLIILSILSNFVLKCHGFIPNICDGMEAIELIPHPGTCDKFILCVLGVPTVVDCEPNHIFDPNTRRCEPGSTETCELYPTPITTSTTRVTQTEPQTTSVPLESTTNDNTEDTTDPLLSTTDQELKTDEISTTSTNELGSATTTELSIESTSISGITITTTLSVPISTSTAVPIHRCPPGGNGYIPHHTNCSRYFECISGIRHLRFCHDEFLFDSVTLRCTYPELAVCAGTK